MIFGDSRGKIRRSEIWFYLIRVPKDIKKLKDHQMKRRIVDKTVDFNEVIQYCVDGEIPGIPNLLKLSAEDVYYRIRIGDYRLGIRIEFAIDDE